MTTLEQDGKQARAERPHYREAQMLTLADLTDEQTARIQAARRHLLTQHRWGVTDGLGLTGGIDVAVAPGHAVDGAGRRMELQQKWILPGDGVDADVNSVDLWLCATRTCSAARIWEQTTVSWTPAGWGTGSHPASPALPDAGLAGDDAPPWPVHLGRVARLGAGQPFSVDQTATVDDAELSGQEIIAAGGGRIAIGTDPADPAVSVTLSDPAQEGTPATGRTRLTIRASGSRLTADTTVAGSVRLSEPGAAVDWPVPVSGDEHPRPWAWYRHRTPAQAAAPPLPAQPELNDLRLELPATSGFSSPAGSMVVTTARGAGTDPPLAVLADGTVLMHRLTPNRVLVAPAQADLSDPRFRQAVEDAWIDETVRVSERVHERFADDPEHPQPLTVVTEDLPAGEPRAGTSVTPKLTVSNSATGDIFQIRVVRTIQLGGAGSAPPVVIVPPITLHQNQRLTVEQPALVIPPGAAGQTLTLMLTAIGVRPSGTVVWSVQARSWTVLAAAPSPGGDFQI